MRIRKRKVPLPLSLLSPIPLSDLHLFSRSPVTVVQQGAATTSTDEDTSQPSDHLTLTSPDASASDLRHLIFSGNREMGVDEGVNDDASKASITTSTRGGAAPTDDNSNNDNNEFRSSLSNNAVGTWCDGDKAIPLKKRRGSSFNQFVEDENTTNTPISLTKVDLKNTINDEEDEDEDEKKTIPASNIAKKGSNKRGNTIMEGSRCSRVNGRGWRCCQPTLVGYSLCEHHLGKGRLRSITIGSSSIIKSRTPNKKKDNSSNNNVDEKKSSSFGNNKRVKLGVVKARSLSSLLGQTNKTMEHHDKLTSNMDNQ